MLPDFLTPFKDKLEKYKLGSIRIEATPISDDETLSVTQSKFLGKPYFPLTADYPTAEDGTPMILLAQINFAEAPAIKDYPTSGILQLFAHGCDIDEYKTIYHETISDKFITDFSFLTPELYDDFPIRMEIKLTMKKLIEYGGYQDVRCIDKLNFDDKDYFEFQDEITGEEVHQMNEILSGTGHKIGGYAFFTQEDPRCFDENLANDVLLLQIDTDNNIMFGDSGIANLFINPEHLKSRDFSKAWFTWDCY